MGIPTLTLIIYWTQPNRSRICITCLFVGLLWLASGVGGLKQILGEISFLCGTETGLSCERGITSCFLLVQSRSDPSLATMFSQFI